MTRRSNQSNLMALDLPAEFNPSPTPLTTQTSRIRSPPLTITTRLPIDGGTEELWEKSYANTLCDPVWQWMSIWQVVHATLALAQHTVKLLNAPRRWHDRPRRHVELHVSLSLFVGTLVVHHTQRSCGCYSPNDEGPTGITHLPPIRNHQHPVSPA